MQMNGEAEQLSLFGQDGCAGKMYPAHSAREHPNTRTSGSFSRRSSVSSAIPFMSLDLTPGRGNLLGEFYWEMISPWRGGSLTLNTGASPKDAAASFLWQILQEAPPRKYYLSRTACLGILRRAEVRGKELPPKLRRALEIQAGVVPLDGQATQPAAYHINQRDEGIDLHGVSGALMATSNMQMQTFVTQTSTAEGFDGYNGDLTGDVAATLGVNCGVSTGRNGLVEPIAFAANQRDEVRDLHDVAGALSAQPGMKQQTFVAGITAKGDGDCFLSEGRHTALSSGGGMPGQGYPCILVAGFSAGAGASAGSIGYSENLSPTLKGSASGNCMPSVLCLNDQGGSVMECSEDVSGTLRAQEHGHQPLVFDNHGQDTRFLGPVKIAQTVSASFGMGGNNQPLIVSKHEPPLYENHGIDARYTGPHPVAPTMSARYGTGGNNLPLVEQTPRAVFSRQRVDVFRENDVACTESARQHKDATDLVLSADDRGLGAYLIRRLTPLECERLQGFPDGWTDRPGASDSARYKALGNSVAIPCVVYVMQGIAWAAMRP